MKFRPLGWELTIVLLSGAALAIAAVFEFEGLTFAVLLGLTILTPLVLLSFVIRLSAGIVAENRRFRSGRAAALVDPPTRDR